MYYIIDNIVSILTFIVLILVIFLPSPWTFVVGVPYLVLYYIYRYFAKKWRIKNYDK